MSLKDKVMNMITLHPKTVTLGIGLAVTLGIVLAVGFVDVNESFARVKRVE